MSAAAEAGEPHPGTKSYPNARHRFGWCRASSMSCIREERI
jgi:hypothetical protein